MTGAKGESWCRAPTLHSRLIDVRQNTRALVDCRFFAAHMLERRCMVSAQKLCALAVSQLHREPEERASWILPLHGPIALDFELCVYALPRKRPHAQARRRRFA